MTKKLTDLEIVSAPDTDSSTLDSVWKRTPTIPENWNVLHSIVVHPNVSTRTLYKAATRWHKPEKHGDNYGARDRVYADVAVFALANKNLDDPLGAFMDGSQYEHIRFPRIGWERISEQRRHLFLSLILSPKINTHPDIIGKVTELCLYYTDHQVDYGILNSHWERFIRDMGNEWAPVHPNSTPEVLRLLWNDRYPVGPSTRKTLIGILHHANCPTDVVIAGAKSSLPDVEAVAAAHPNCPLDLAITTALRCGR